MRYRLLRAAVPLLLIAALLAATAAGCGPSHKSAVTNASLSSTGGATDTVHATATGKRYHREGCSSLSKSDIPMTRKEAEAKGLTPCKVCKP